MLETPSSPGSGSESQERNGSCAPAARRASLPNRAEDSPVGPTMRGGMVSVPHRTCCESFRSWLPKRLSIGPELGRRTICKILQGRIVSRKRRPFLRPMLQPIPAYELDRQHLVCYFECVHLIHFDLLTFPEGEIGHSLRNSCDLLRRRRSDPPVAARGASRPVRSHPYRCPRHHRGGRHPIRGRDRSDPAGGFVCWLGSWPVVAGGRAIARPLNPRSHPVLAARAWDVKSGLALLGSHPMLLFLNGASFSAETRVHFR